MKIVAVIPARYNSSRYEGKPLVDICGEPMIWWVYQQAKKVALFDEVFVATDDSRIETVCRQKNLEVMMTSGSHKTGTDRVAEVARKVAADLYVNIQGDEPMIEPEVINRVLHTFIDGRNYDVVNAMTRILDPVEVTNSTVPKVVANKDGIGLYLSRVPIPYPKGSLDYYYYKQVCVYAFTPEMLAFFSSSPRGKIEAIEDIEILRFIESGYRVMFVEVDSRTIAVDTEKDADRVRKIIGRGLRERNE